MQDWVRDNFTRKGLIAERQSIHAPDKQGDMRNTHAHVAVGVAQAGRHRIRGEERTDGEQTTSARQNWKRSGRAGKNSPTGTLSARASMQRIDRRTLKEQGIDAEPTSIWLGRDHNHGTGRGTKRPRRRNREIEERNAALRERAALEIAATKAQAELAAARQLEEMERRFAAASSRVSEPAAPIHDREAAGSGMAAGSDRRRRAAGGAGSTSGSTGPGKMIRAARRKRASDPQQTRLEKRRARRQRRHRPRSRASARARQRHGRTLTPNAAARRSTRRQFARSASSIRRWARRLIPASGQRAAFLAALAVQSAVFSAGWPIVSRPPPPPTPEQAERMARSAEEKQEARAEQAAQAEREAQHWLIIGAQQKAARSARKRRTSRKARAAASEDRGYERER